MKGNIVLCGLRIILITLQCKTALSTLMCSLQKKSARKKIDDDKTATREFFSCDEGTIVYHTARENIFVEYVQRPYINKFKYRRCCDNND